MTLTERSCEVDGVRLAGFLADGSRGSKVPGILIAREAPGISNNVKSNATMLAECEYLCFVLDMYGRATNLSRCDLRRYVTRATTRPSFVKAHAETRWRILLRQIERPIAM